MVAGGSLFSAETPVLVARRQKPGLATSRHLVRPEEVRLRPAGFQWVTLRRGHRGGVAGVAGGRVNFSLTQSRVVKFVVLCEMSLMISA